MNDPLFALSVTGLIWGIQFFVLASWWNGFEERLRREFMTQKERDAEDFLRGKGPFPTHWITQ